MLCEDVAENLFMAMCSRLLAIISLSRQRRPVNSAELHFQWLVFRHLLARLSSDIQKRQACPVATNVGHIEINISIYELCRHCHVRLKNIFSDFFPFGWLISAMRRIHIYYMHKFLLRRQDWSEVTQTYRMCARRTITTWSSSSLSMSFGLVKNVFTYLFIPLAHTAMRVTTNRNFYILLRHILFTS